MNFDTIERIGDSEVHHGSLNDRVYLTELHRDDMDDVLDKVANLVDQKKYGKIVSRIPRWALHAFLERGYRVEAEIPRLYRGDTDGYIVAEYPRQERVWQPEQEERYISSVKTVAMAASDTSPKVPCEGYEIRRLHNADMAELATLYKKVFSNYPYPVFDPGYLCNCLEDHYEFYGIFREGRLLEAAMLHLNKVDSYAEIIDFVIPLESKGQNLSYHLLQAIKDSLANSSIKTILSSVRATSFGLNITLKKQGFLLGGTLVNNTRVGHTLQSMNIWYWKEPKVQFDR